MIILDSESRAMLKQIAQLEKMSGNNRTETEIIHGALHMVLESKMRTYVFAPEEKEVKTDKIPEQKKHNTNKHRKGRRFR